MPGPTDSFRFEIDLDESGYVQGANRVRASSQSIDAGLQALTDGLYGVNSAFQLIRRSGSGYVSAQEVLQSVNVQTTQSIESQIAALEHLKSTTGGDAAQIRQLAQMQEQLASSYRLTASEIEAAASGNTTYANALIRLNSLGIQTTEQLEMQANELMRLQNVFKGDEQAVRSLTTALDALFAR